MAIGREKFKSEMALLAGHSVALGVPGRPKKAKVKCLFTLLIKRYSDLIYLKS